ncbi:MAG TPA: PIN domain-containing protein [Candidatus Nitrosopolaris rasttigaisensis]|nr:PIN domain-containing protein [Candidatus Nitrosopolaris rasttigaisensis]
MPRNRNQKAVFVDTSAIAAFVNEKESGHEEAIKKFGLLEENGYYLFISNYIVAEVYALILNRNKVKDTLQRTQLAFDMLEWLHDEETFTILFVDKLIEKKAREELLRHNDKLWSIADMTSFLLMVEGGIPYFLSFDSDFNQASGHFGFYDIRPYLPQ